MTITGQRVISWRFDPSASMPPKLLAIGAHPDDVEFGCAAILINEIRRGGVVKIWVLSKGEAGSNGTPEIREAESRRAGELIGAEVEFADFGGDCHIDYTPATPLEPLRADGKEERILHWFL